MSGNEPHLDKTPNKTSDQPPKYVSSKEKLAKVLSPQTNGANVPSPFKKIYFGQNLKENPQERERTLKKNFLRWLVAKNGASMKKRNKKKRKRRKR